MQELFFRTNAKVESLLGRDLITNDIIAIFELVKNAYDAGAQYVKITFDNIEYPLKDKDPITDHLSSISIKDDGKGMTFEEVEKYWMELGTPYKEENRESEIRVRENEIEKIINRRVNGEKGIGRFGVDKIGAELTLISVDRDHTEKTTVTFNWDDFDDRSKLINEVPCLARKEVIQENDNHGTELIITRLRDQWRSKDLFKLEKELKKFISPLKFDDNDFQIELIFNYRNREPIKTNIENDTFDYLGTYIEADLSVDGILNYSIYDCNDEVIDECILYNEEHSFGRVITRIYYLDKADKNRFTKRMGLRTSDYGNIRIYKDNFRVMPYGDSHNDWLEIDKKHAQGFYRTFGTRDLVGYVLLSHNDEWENHGLKEATDRVGLIEDVKEYGELKEFLWEAIEVLEKYVFKILKSESTELTQELETETTNLKKDTVDTFIQIDQIIEDSSLNEHEKAEIKDRLIESNQKIQNNINQIEDTTKRIDKKIKIYSQITTKEGILFDMLHKIKNKIAIIESQLVHIQEATAFKSMTAEMRVISSAFDSIKKMVTGSLNRVNSVKLEKKPSSLNDLINEVMIQHIAVLSENEIELELELGDDCQIMMSSESIKINVFDNLFSNSIKALENSTEKLVRIETLIEDKTVKIIFSDTGKGIPEEARSRVFSLWETATEGTGIGLATAKDTVLDHEGKIDYINVGYERFATSFMLEFPIYK